MRSVNQLRGGVVLSNIGQLINFAVGIVYTPILISCLGQEEYGAYQLAATFIATLGILNFGFSGSYLKFYFQLRETGSEKELRRLNGTFASIFIIITAAALLAGTVCIIFSNGILGDKLSPDYQALSKKLMAVSLVSLALTLVNNIFNCNITAHENFVFQRSSDIARTLLAPLLSVALLTAGMRSLGAVTAAAVVNLLGLLANVYYSVSRLKMRFSFRFDRDSKKLFRQMGTFTWYLFLCLIVEQVNWNVDNYLLGRLAGPSTVAVFALSAYFVAAFKSISCSVSSVFSPAVNRMVSQNSGDGALSALFIKIGRMQFFILSLVFSGFVLFGRTFIALWVGEAYEVSYSVIVILLGSLFIPLIQNTGIEIQKAKNRHKARAVVYALIAVGNIGISIPLIKLFGAVGAALGTAVALILGNVVFMNIYYRKRIGLDMRAFWKRIIAACPSVLLPAAAGFWALGRIEIRNFFELAGAAAVYTAALSASVWFLGADAGEKTLIRKALKKLRGGRK